MAHSESAPKTSVLMLYLEPSILRITKGCLAEAGFTVATARTEREALAILYGDQAKHVVLMDNLRFHREGQAFLAALTQEPALRKRVKVVAMASDYASKALREKYGDLVDEYLVLPFAFDQLLAAVTYP